MKILISACLLGVNCKYDGGNNRAEALLPLLRGHDVRSVCPEVLGGLPVPRTPAEMKNGKVVFEDGTSADLPFRAGARAGLALTRMLQPDLVILKSRSPSCGTGEIYDGSFSHVHIPGDGVFAGLLKQEGFRVITDEDAPHVLSAMKLPAAESAGGKVCHD